MALLDDDLSQPATNYSDTFRITTLQKQDPTCITLLSWIRSADFPPWIEVKDYAQNLDRCGIIGIICRWMTMVRFGERGALRITCYNYWFPNQHANNCSCHIMHLCLATIWAGIEHWPSWHIAFIGRACRMMSKNALDNVLFVSKGSLRPDATTL